MHLPSKLLVEFCLSNFFHVYLNCWFIAGSLHHFLLLSLLAHHSSDLQVHLVVNLGRIFISVQLVSTAIITKVRMIHDRKLYKICLELP